jgi:hypothetical protein
MQAHESAPDDMKDMALVGLASIMHQSGFTEDAVHLLQTAIHVCSLPM